MSGEGFWKTGCLLTASLLLQACFVAPETPCLAQTDCAAGLTCSDGSCVPAEVVPEPDPAPEPETPSPVTFDPFWTVETVLEGEWSLGPTIRMMSNGEPEIALWTGPFGDSMVNATTAVRTGTTWDVDAEGVYDPLSSRFEVLRGGPDHTFALADGSRFAFTELNAGALDRYRLMDTPHTYGDAFDSVMTPDGKLHGITRATGKLLYFLWDGDRSQVQLQTEELADVCGDGALDTCPAFLHIDVDGNGEPRLLYRGVTDATLTWGRHAGGQWQFETLPSSVQPGEVTWSSSGEPTVCFAEEGVLTGSTTVRCMRDRAGQWSSLDLIVNQKDTNAWINSALELPDGTLHVLFQEESRDTPVVQRVTWARLDGTTWTRHEVVTTEITSSQPPQSRLYGGALALDANGEPHIALSFDTGLYYLRPAP